jgi:hypothetical protein
MFPSQLIWVRGCGGDTGTGKLGNSRGKKQDVELFFF